MNNFRNLLPSVLTGAAFMLAATVSSAREVSFQYDVRPILSDKCYKCHGFDAKNQKSDFRVHTFEEATADLGGYAGVVPGNLEDSELILRIITDDPDDIMPTPESKMSLTEDEVEILKLWVEQGAKYEKHWAFDELPKEVSVPKTSRPEAKNEIDQFVFARLKEGGFEPAPEVTKEKWLRRVTFDLTGLPPTLEELDAFLADSSADAYEKQVDRLLNTQAYAERLTNEWLDVARYADSYGYQVDRDRRVWPWRDWVIRSFKENLHYDDFITHQLAGDLVPDASRETRLATAFNRLHGQKVEGGSVEEEFRQEYIADRANTVGTAFLGLTMECSKCHDHKYDPITQKDYFSLSAFFNNIDEAGLYAYHYKSTPTPNLDLPSAKQEQALESASKNVAHLEEQLKQQRETSEAEFQAWLDGGNLPGLQPGGEELHLTFDEVKKGKVRNIATESDEYRISKNKQIQGINSKALEFDGDSPIEIPNKLGDFDREQPFTYSFSFYLPTEYEHAVLFARGWAMLDAGSRGHILRVADGKLHGSLAHFWPGNAASIQTKSKLATKTWHHFTWTYDGSSEASGMSFYLNGKPIEVDVTRDNLTRTIAGAKNKQLYIGALRRDKGFKNGRIDDFRTFTRELAPGEVASLAGLTEAPDREALAELFYEQIHQPSVQLHEELKQARKGYYKAQDAISQIMVMEEWSGPRKKHHVLNRGLYSDKGTEVKPRTPGFLPPLNNGDPSSVPTRLDLAEWLTGPDQPLTARVTVNRYWQMFFENGLVRSSEDFGNQGSLPTHPDLLNWLARDFIDNDWNLHHLFRKIVLSHTYRQSTQAHAEFVSKDPENEFLARANATPLTAEMLRDNALSVSKLLAGKVGGAPVKPYDIALAFSAKGTPEVSKGEGVYRRSIYTYWKVNGPSPLMLTLDAAKRNVCTVRREKTATPLQSLVLLNSPQFVEAGRATAERLLAQNLPVGDIIETAFRLTTSRFPSSNEREILQRLYDEQLAHFTEHPSEASDYIATGNTKPSESHSQPQLAALTALVTTLLNFDECNRSY